MTKHVIISFTYNYNNDVLVRVLNYPSISYFERMSHLNKWQARQIDKLITAHIFMHKDNDINVSHRY